jgi:dipeptidyl aminopeptidase/acylaminoacyl peptidase
LGDIDLRHGMTSASAQDRVAAVFESLLALRVPSDPRVSPDGRTVAFVLPGAATDGAPERSGTAGSLVHLLDLTGPEPREHRPLSPAGLNAAFPRWSGDGRLVVVAGSVSDTGPANDCLVALDRDTGECVWTQHFGGAIEDVVIIGRTVVARVADPGSERDGMHLGLRVPDNTDPWVTRPKKRWRRLVRAEIGKQGVSDLPLPGWTVWDFDVRTDGRIVVVASQDPRPAGYYRPSLLVTDLDGTVPRQLLTGPRQLSRPRLSSQPGEAWVVEGRSIVSGRVLRVDTTGGSVTVVPALDDVTDLGVLADGRIWFTGWAGMGVQVGLLEGGQVTQRWTSAGSLGGPDAQPGLTVTDDGTGVLSVWGDGDHPPEIAAASLSQPGWRALTAVNANLAGLSATVSRQEVSWPSPDGTVVHGLLITPADPVGNLPLVVIVHGGPTWLWSDAFAPGECNAIAVPLASAGAAVLLPNPRGSSGRGRAYCEAVIGQVGDVDLQDILSGVDALVDQGVADPARLAVMGLSYGGFMAAWATTRTDRFRAAVVMSGVSDWLSFAQSSNLAGGYDLMYHPAGDLTTAEGREELVARSPAYRADEAGTPTLVLHGAEDRVTPVGQAEQLHTAWAAGGVAVKLVVYPREGHELVETAHRRDAMRQVVSWLSEHGVLE